MTLVMPLNDSVLSGELKINGVSMHTPAWCVLDVLPLYLPTGTRGHNSIIPHTAGRYPRPLRIDESRYSLPMLISGGHDRNGNVYADRWAGLQANLVYLNSQIVTPPTYPVVTVEGILRMPDGTVRGADVQVPSIELLNPRTTGAQLEAILELVVPSGQFVTIAAS